MPGKKYIKIASVRQAQYAWEKCAHSGGSKFFSFSNSKSYFIYFYTLLNHLKSKKGEWKTGERERTELRERLIKKNVASYITSNSFLVFWVVKIAYSLRAEVLKSY